MNRLLWTGFLIVGLGQGVDAAEFGRFAILQGVTTAESTQIVVLHQKKVAVQYYLQHSLPRPAGAADVSIRPSWVEPQQRSFSA
jgi:hypothetical protein